MLVGPQGSFLDPFEHFNESGIAREIATERQRVHEQSDQVFGLRHVASCDRRADNDVFFPGVAMQ